MAAKQSKMEEKQENMTETNQKWQKTDKNDRKPWKMWSFTNYLLDLRIGPEEEVLVILLRGFLTLLTLLAIHNSAIYNDKNITILF